MNKHLDLIGQVADERWLAPAATTTTKPHYGIEVETIAQEMQWATEEAQRLVQQVFLVQTLKPPKVVVFSGIDHGNGCSRISVAIAKTLAKTSARPVCLVDANFRCPSLPAMFGVANHYGLTESLLHSGAIHTFARDLAQDNLWLLSAGSLASDSPGLLTSVKLRERMMELREEFDYVIVDTPPLGRYSDAIVLGHVSDGIILVVEADATRREAASTVVTSLRSVKVPILAAVLNKRVFPIPDGIYRRL